MAVRVAWHCVRLLSGGSTSVPLRAQGFTGHRSVRHDRLRPAMGRVRQDVTGMGRDGRAGDSNTALRTLLDEAGMSNAALARAVVTAGAEEGVHVGTNTTSVKRRSEEHTSELQSRENLVCRLLLEKKKKH